MNKSLLDTDIFSEILKGKNATVHTRAVNYRKTFDRYTIAAPSVTELVDGFTHAEQTTKLNNLRIVLTSVEVFPFVSKEADLAGEITGRLARLGTPIGIIDPMIAAIAILNELTLVTGNTQHFLRIVALGYPLLLDNWRDA